MLTSNEKGSLCCSNAQRHIRKRCWLSNTPIKTISSSKLSFSSKTMDTYFSQTPTLSTVEKSKLFKNAFIIENSLPITVTSDESEKDLDFDSESSSGNEQQELPVSIICMCSSFTLE